MDTKTNTDSENSRSPRTPMRGGRSNASSQSKVIISTKSKRKPPGMSARSSGDLSDETVNRSAATATPNVVPPSSFSPVSPTASPASLPESTPEEAQHRKQEQAEKLRFVEAQQKQAFARLDEGRITAEKRAEEMQETYLENERQKLQQEQNQDETPSSTASEDTATPTSVDSSADTSKAVEGDRSKREDKDRRQNNVIEEEKERHSPKVAKSLNQRRQGSKLTVAQALREEDDMLERTRSLAMLKRKREKERLKSRQALGQSEKIKREVIVPETITVGTLASRMTERTSDVIKKLFNMGVVATSSHEIDADTAELVVAEFGHECRRVADADVESILEETLEISSDEPLSPRPPIVTVMGHVDHGKTSLLDALRQTNVQAGEAGGITQGIRAYQVKVHTKDQPEIDRHVTFIDTPGHEAFTAMRARGADVTDIVILIVAADSGIMPQTIEAINHAKAADVPIVVAINKIDLPAANIDKVYNQLLEHGIVPEHLGGDALCIPISVKSGEGIQDLLVSVLLQADLLECKSPLGNATKGVVLEARIDKGKGCVVTLLVSSGTLKKGDVFVVGSTWGKVKNILDDRGKNIDVALPSQPVEIFGATSPPLAGDSLQVMPKNQEAKAQEIATYRLNTEKNKRLNKAGQIDSIDAMFDRFRENAEQQTLNIIVKADVQGMVEAIKANLENIAFDNHKVRIIHAGVGAVSVSDVALATTSKGMIVAFNVKLPPECERKARQENIQVIHHDVIHHLIEGIEERLQKLLKPEIEEILLGSAEVREVFDMGKHGIIAGCAVVSGKIVKSGRFIVNRDQDTNVYEGPLKSLRRFRNEVTSVDSGYECGMTFGSFDKFAVGDVIQCYGQKT